MPPFKDNSSFANRKVIKKLKIHYHQINTTPSHFKKKNKEKLLVITKKEAQLV